MAGHITVCVGRPGGMAGSVLRVRSSGQSEDRRVIKLITLMELMLLEQELNKHFFRH